MADHKTKIMTADFAGAKFAPHGLMEAVEAEGFILCDITGPFNIEFIQSYFRMWRSRFSNWPKGKQVLVLTRWHRTMMGTPDAITSFTEVTMAQAKFVGGHHVWHVPNDIEGGEIMTPIWAKPYRDLDINLDIYSIESAALHRIAELRDGRVLTGEDDAPASDGLPA